MQKVPVEGDGSIQVANGDAMVSKALEHNVLTFRQSCKGVFCLPTPVDEADEVDGSGQGLSSGALPPGPRP